MYKYLFETLLSLPLGYMPRSGIAGSWGNSVFHFTKELGCHSQRTGRACKAGASGFIREPPYDFSLRLFLACVGCGPVRICKKMNHRKQTIHGAISNNFHLVLPLVGTTTKKTSQYSPRDQQEKVRGQQGNKSQLRRPLEGLLHVSEKPQCDLCEEGHRERSCAH